jgi:hypothetical protein
MTWEESVMQRLKQAVSVTPNAVTCGPCRSFVLEFKGFPDGDSEIAWLARSAAAAYTRFSDMLMPVGDDEDGLYVRPGRRIDVPRQAGGSRLGMSRAEMRHWNARLRQYLEKHLTRHRRQDPRARRGHLWRELIAPLLPLQLQGDARKERDRLRELLGEAAYRRHISGLKYDIYPVIRAVAYLGSNDRRVRPVYTYHHRSKALEALCTRRDGESETVYIRAGSFDAALRHGRVG